MIVPGSGLSTLRSRSGDAAKNGSLVAPNEEPGYESVAAAKRSPLTRSPTKIRILVVHGSSITRHGLAALFARHRRFSVCAETADAPAARELVIAHRPDAIIAGLSLRHGDGIEFMKAVRKEDRQIRILVLTQRNDALSVDRAFRAGAHGYLLVQDDIEEIHRALSEILRGRYYASPSIAQRLLGRLAGGEISSATGELSRFSDRELQVFRLIAQGLGPSRVARELHLSVKTIETHRMRIKVKLGLGTGADLNQWAQRWLARKSFQSG